MKFEKYPLMIVLEKYCNTGPYSITCNTPVKSIYIKPWEMIAVLVPNLSAILGIIYIGVIKIHLLES